MADCARKTTAPAADPLAHFADMVEHCLDYAEKARKQGRPIVGILCEYTPRELILAGGGVPVCLCGGSAEMIPPAEEVLPANLCPLVKSTFGYHVTKANPFLEMAGLVVAETTCDAKKKMYELMSRTRDVYVLELPQKPDDADAAVHWRAELDKLRSFLQRRWKTRITDAGLRKAIRQMNEYRGLKRRLWELQVACPPPLTGMQILAANGLIWGMDEDMTRLREVIGAIRPPRGHGAQDTRTRVLLTGVPVPHGAEKVVEIIESGGGVVVCMENCSGLKPVSEDVAETGDPMAAIAAKYLRVPCSVMTPNDRRMESLRALAAQYRPHCVVDLVWQACLTYDVESFRVKELADELGLPYLRIGTDYSPGDASRIALRVEALLEMASARGGT